MWLLGWKGPFGFSGRSTAEEVTRGIDGSGLTAIITGLLISYLFMISFCFFFFFFFPLICFGFMFGVCVFYYLEDMLMLMGILKDATFHKFLQLLVSTKFLNPDV